MKILALDCENSYGTLQPWHEGFYLTVVSLVTDISKEAVWFNHKTRDPTPRGVDQIQQAIDIADVIVGHNLKHDLNILRYYGVDFEGKKLYCTMVGDYLIEGQNTKELKFNLNAVAERYKLPPKLDKVAEYWAKGVDTFDVPEDILEEYVHNDAIKAFELYKLQQPRIEEIGLRRVIDLQMEFIFSLSDMEMTGFEFDIDLAYEIVNEYTEKLNKIEAKIKEVVGEPRLNIGSNQQLAAALYGGKCKVEWKEWVVKTLKVRPESTYKEMVFSEEIQLDGLGFTPPKGSKTKTGVSVKDGVIKKLKAKTKVQKEVKQLLLKKGKIAQVIKMMIGKHKDKGIMTKRGKDGRIHPTFNNARTVTGRLSSSDPNGQNLPRGNTSPIKTCIKPKYDGIAQWDLSQIEWRGAAQLSNDLTMIHEINSDIDQHAAAVTEIMELEFVSKDDPVSKEHRQNAKTVNFRMIYGGNAYGFYMSDEMPPYTLKKWESICGKFFSKYNGLYEWHQNSIAFVELNGYSQIPTGRWFKFHKKAIDYKYGGLKYKDSEIKNYPVQGIAGGDILPMLCVIIRRAMRKHNMKSQMILTVHDSLVFDYVQEELELLTKICKSVTIALPDYIEKWFGFKWNCKLDGEMEIGDSYGNLHAYAETKDEHTKNWLKDNH